MTRLTTLRLLAATLGVSTIASAAKAAATIVDLGTLGGTFSDANGYGTLNNAGQVVGYSYTTGNAAQHAFRSAANSALTPANDLGTLGGTFSAAYGINASGQAVGYSRLNATTAHAFRTAAGGAVTPGTDLGTFGGSTSIAYGINTSGQVAGVAFTANDAAPHAFRTAANGAILPSSDLGTLGGASSAASGINVSGQVVGNSTKSGSSAQHAFRTAANGPVTATSDLGTLGGSGSQAFGINNAGQAVGVAYTTNDAAQHAFRTAANGAITASSDLGTLGGTNSYASAINTAGQVVGYSSTASGGIDAFFADVTGPMIDLNSLLPVGSGWRLTTASGINDAGEISGSGVINGQSHVFLITAFSVTHFPGDATGDGHVNFDDLVVLAQHYNQTTGNTYATGDFTQDGSVNFDDLVILAQHYNQTAPGFLTGDLPAAFGSDWALAQSLAPEPATFIALAAAGALTFGRRRRTHDSLLPKVCFKKRPRGPGPRRSIGVNG